MKDLEKRILIIEERNKKVETDKLWETSKTRVIFICFITYIIAVMFMKSVNTQNVFFSALIPVIGFYLSTQSLGLIRKVWQKYN
ncbi:MAG TPA: hypothetical protein DCP90_05220 [Clostridiales bacterium]|nr:MAG: hypothetical protein A2Y22_08985 [Clostridiales bacterium GWD2_32_59]HAN10000.1 hypothetical protein [Clostridiales bacterium]